MSDNAVEYKTYGDGIKKFISVEEWQERNLKEPRNIDLELKLGNDITQDNTPSMKMKGFKQEIDTRKKTYEIEPTMNGVLIKGFIDGKLVDTGICKFNRKDKLDVN